MLLIQVGQVSVTGEIMYTGNYQEWSLRSKVLTLGAINAIILRVIFLHILCFSFNGISGVTSGSKLFLQSLFSHLNSC